MGVRGWGGGGDGHEAWASLPLQGLEKPVDPESVEAGPTSGAVLREFLSPTFSVASDSVWEWIASALTGLRLSQG